MLFRQIACHEPPCDADRDAENCAEPEGCPPAVVHDQPAQQWRCQSAACSYTGKDQSVDEAALSGRHPLGYPLIGRRIHDRLAGSQQEANPQEPGHGVSHRRRQCGRTGRRYAPPDRTQCKRAPRAPPHCQPPGWYLEDGIPNQECAEDDTELLVAEAILPAHLNPGDGNVRAVEKCDGAKHEEPEGQQVANAKPRRSARIQSCLLLSERPQGCIAHFKAPSTSVLTC